MAPVSPGLFWFLTSGLWQYISHSEDNTILKKNYSSQILIMYKLPNSKSRNTLRITGNLPIDPGLQNPGETPPPSPRTPRTPSLTDPTLLSLPGSSVIQRENQLSTCPCCLHCRTRQQENKHSSVIIEVETWDGRRGESFTYFLIFLWFHVSVYVSAAVTSKTWMVRFQL